MASSPRQGEIWLVEYGEPGDKEQQLESLVISVDLINGIDSASILVLPIFPHMATLPSRVQIDGAGAKISGYAACEQIRAIARARFKKVVGQVSNGTIVECQAILTRLLGLKPLPNPRGWSA